MKDQHFERPRDVSWVFWLALPLASLAMRLLVPLLGEARCEFLMRNELGLVENATVLFLLPAFVVSVLIFLRRRELPRGAGWVMLIVALAALFFAGEEISWGQHYFGFDTPKAIAEVNRQQEFNIHNTYGKYGGNLVNNVPRQLLNAAMFAAIVLPIVLFAIRHRLEKSGFRRSIWYWLIPNYRLIPIALMAVLLRLPDKLFGPQAPDSYLSLSLIRASGEFKEYCFALAILVYVLSVYARMGRRKAKRQLS